ncbi:hypothetical protein [Paracoccus yeei]|jgi:hypothetical protein|nr:hypothetical protein [Paracoccus yeei]
MTMGPADPGRPEPLMEAAMAPKDGTKGLFRAPAPLTAMDRTTSEARQIIADQTERRQQLTAKLRAARLAQAAAAPEPAPAAKRGKKT